MSFTIETGKETGLVQLNVVPRPIVLCQIQAVNPSTGLVDSGSDTVYLTTTPALGGGTQTYNGNTYQALLQANPIDQIQAQSPQGYDIPGAITLTIADATFALWSNHANTYGWRGGTLTVTFILWDVASNTFSTNAYVWTFICDKPTITSEGVITLAAQSRQSMTRLNVPNFARQNRCGNTFPATAAQRLDALMNPTSVYYGCSYSPDQAGGVGNQTTPNLTNPDGSALTDSAGNFVMCDYTRSCGSRTALTQGCMARLGNQAGNPVGATVTVQDGDITRDTSGRATGNFTGDTELAPVGWKGRQYVNPSAGTQYGFNVPNPPTGATYFNQGYGTQWVDATVLAVYGDPNSTRAECVVCIAPTGPVGQIITVLCNGVQLNENNSDALFTYYVITPGGRNGFPSTDSGFFNGRGDPHGSQCVIEFVVPVELSTSSSIPSIQVLLQFPQCLHLMPIATAAPSGSNTVLTFTAGTTNIDLSSGICYVQGNSGLANAAYTVVASTSGSITIATGGGATGTLGAVFYYPLNTADAAMIDSTGAAAANPVWALMDLLCWGPFTVVDFDPQSWYNAAQFCAVPINYTDINGNAATHARYRCSMVLKTSQRMSMAKAVLGLRNCAGIILGRIPTTGQLVCYIEQTLADQQPAPVPGSNYNTPVASQTAAGVSANGYLAYLFDGAGSIEKGTFKLGGRSINDTPNTVAVPFQDSANVWVADSCTTIDPKGYISAGKQEIAAPFTALGLENFDQVTRRSNLELAKAMYGNARFDAGGTELPSFRTTVKAAHLASRAGFIIGINYEQLDL